MNQVSLIGRITKDLVIKMTESGKKVVNFNLAINRIGTDAADYPQIVAWEKAADILEKYAHKGSRIGVAGRIQTRNYEDSDGKRIYITEVVARDIYLLDPKQNETENMYQPADEFENDMPF